MCKIFVPWGSISLLRIWVLVPWESRSRLSIGICLRKSCLSSEEVFDVLKQYGRLTDRSTEMTRPIEMLLGVQFSSSVRVCSETYNIQVKPYAFSRNSLFVRIAVGRGSEQWRMILVWQFSNWRFRDRPNFSAKYVLYLRWCWRIFPNSLDDIVTSFAKWCSVWSFGIEWFKTSVENTVRLSIVTWLGGCRVVVKEVERHSEKDGADNYNRWSTVGWIRPSSVRLRWRAGEIAIHASCYSVPLVHLSADGTQLSLSFSAKIVGKWNENFCCQIDGHY